MSRDLLRRLFSTLDPEIKSVIEQVLQLEQENITMERPRINDRIDEIITEEAKRILGTSKGSRTG
ncbi:hypothetical protein [Chloroflexus sp.]|uniref:hypothetical protein n=1 Tax=Chloroflexus sp. TaxID=1904827 RepID=UPI002ACD80AD|nr:hypothetical protein [Chloroflexus sp.]